MSDEFGFDAALAKPDSDEFGFDAASTPTRPQVSAPPEDRGHFNPLGAALKLAGSAAGSVAGGYRGLYDVATGKSAEQAAKDVTTTQEALTPTVNPATEEALASKYNPLNWVGMAGKYAGEKAQELGASPGVATAVETGINALPMLAGVRGIREPLANRFTSQAPVNPVTAIDTALEGTGKTIRDLSPELQAKTLEAATQGPLRADILKAQVDADGITSLTEGQATGDPHLFAKEVETAKRAGKDQPPPGSQEYASHFERQRQDLLNYLDNKLGAGVGVTPESAGTAAITKIAQIDKNLSDGVNQAYNKVRDSEGRSAKLDPEDFYTKAESALERDNSTAFLPKEIAGIYDAYTSGKMPLTVDSMMSFDKILSRAARTTQDGNALHAINIVRKALNDTSISGEAGAQAAADYAAARNLARQRFELTDPKSQRYIPAYDAAMKAMGNASHDEFIAALQNGTANISGAKWFDSNVAKATPSAAKKLMQGFNAVGATNEASLLQQGLLRSIRDDVVKGNPLVGERQNLSGDALSRVLADKSPTLSQVLSPDAMEGLNKLSRTATKIQRAPQGSPINYSGTSAALDYMGQVPGQVAKQAATAAGGAVAGPVGAAAVEGGIRLRDVLKGSKAAKQARAEAERAVNPPLSEAAPTPSLGQRFAKRAAEGLTLSQFLGDRNE